MDSHRTLSLGTEGKNGGLDSVTLINVDSQKCYFTEMADTTCKQRECKEYKYFQSFNQSTAIVSCKSQRKQIFTEAVLATY